MLSQSSIQSKDFRPLFNPELDIDKLRKNLSSLVKKVMGNVEEGLRGMEDTNEVMNLRNDLAKNLNEIDRSYAKSVLETSVLMDKFAKKIDEQQITVNEVLGKTGEKDSDKKMESLYGMNEDSATFQRLGSSRFIFYLIIAVVCVILTIMYVKLDFTPYMLASLILSGIFIFIMVVFYGK